MGVGTATPCCPCIAGTLCDPDGESSWQDDFESYQQGQSLGEFGYLPITNFQPNQPFCDVDFSGNKGIRPQSLSSSVSYVQRQAPADFERFSQFKFSANIVSNAGQLQGLTMFTLPGLNETEPPTSKQGGFVAYTYSTGQGGSIFCKAFNASQQFPPPSQLSYHVEITVSIASWGTFQLFGRTYVSVSGTARFLGLGVEFPFDETLAFDTGQATYGTANQFCRAQYGVAGTDLINGFKFISDQWDYSAT